MAAKTKDYFYLRQVILGLRSEYIENQKKLDEIKKYLLIEDKGVRDTSLFMNRILNNYYLAIYLDKRQSLLKKALKEIDHLVTGRVEQNEIMIYKGFGDRNNFICSNELKSVDYNDFNSFCCESDHLLSTSFNTELVDNYYRIGDEKLGIKVGHQGVFVLTDDDRSCVPCTGVDYHADKDQLVVTSYYNTSSPDGIYKVLDSRIPYCILGKTTIENIKNSEDKDLPIEIDGYTYDNYSSQYFRFEKDNDVMKLKRVK